jgi:hypothetical protein
MAKANNQRAEDKAGELKQLNKSIFKPVIVWNKVRVFLPFITLPSIRVLMLTYRTPNALLKNKRSMTATSTSA